MLKKALHIVRKERRGRKIRSKISGTELRPRLVVYRSNTSIFAQLIDDNKGVTLASISDLKSKGKTKTEKALTAGEEFAKIALEKKLEACVFDRNGCKYLGRVKAFAEGARNGGLKF